MNESLPIGTRLAGRYEILDLLGKGGMASVYRARDLGTGRPVALKVLAPAADASARLSREVWNAARLDHPGCVRILDVGEGDPRFLVMELLQGPTLRDVIDARGRLPIAEAASIAHDIAAALAHAHDAGVLHRDIKPANVMVGDRHAVVIDFGLSRNAFDDPLTALGTCVGSPSYVAPERLLGHDYDGRADIYSVGAVLFEMLAGERPFRGASAIDIAQQHIAAPVPDITRVRPDVPPALATVVTRALAKQPQERFALAASLASTLEAVAETAPWRPAPVCPRDVAQAMVSSATMQLSLSDSALFQQPS